MIGRRRGKWKIENRKIRKGKDLMGSKQNKMGKGKDQTDMGLERITLEEDGTGSN